MNTVLLMSPGVPLLPWTQYSSCLLACHYCHEHSTPHVSWRAITALNTVLLMSPGVPLQPWTQYSSCLLACHYSHEHSTPHVSWCAITALNTVLLMSPGVPLHSSLSLQQVTKEPPPSASSSTALHCASSAPILQRDSPKLQRGMQTTPKLREKSHFLW
jgi:hypothetical protein